MTKRQTIDCDITLDRTGCTTNLQLMPQASSGSRVQMQGAHYSQAVQLEVTELRNLFSGVERDYANYMFDVRVERDCKVIRRINRMPRINAKDQTPLETVLVVEVVAGMDGEPLSHPEIDVIHIPRFIQNHQTFATELVRTPLADKGKGTFLKKGSLLARSKTVKEDEFCVGVHANTILACHPLVIEDSCLISQSLADKMLTWGYKTHRITVGNKYYPLLINKDENGNPAVFPDVGQKVRDDGILFACREYDPILAAVEMSHTSMHEPCGHFDEPTFVDPNSVITDIKVYRDGQRKREYDNMGKPKASSKMSTPTGIQELCDEHAEAQSNFQHELRSAYLNIKRDYSAALRSRRLKWTGEATQTFMYSIADNPSEVNHNAPRFAMQYGKQRCEDYMIEITVRYPIGLSVSGKITDTMGGKGVVGMVKPDHEMPYDEFGNRVDLVMSENAMLRRTNFNRGFENYINAARRDVQKRALAMCDVTFEPNAKTPEPLNKNGVEEAFKYITDFLDAVNPKWSDAVRKSHPEFQDKVAYMREMQTKELRIWIPSNNPFSMDDVERNVQDNFSPDKSKLNITLEDGTVTKTVNDIMIGQIYMIRLEKTGREFSSIAAGRFQAFGTIAKQHSSDKHKRPCRESPIKFMGESECRHQTAFIGGSVCIETRDCSNNPVTHETIIENILEAPLPTNIQQVVDRTKLPVGNDSVVKFADHVRSCDGFRLTTTGHLRRKV